MIAFYDKWPGTDYRDSLYFQPLSPQAVWALDYTRNNWTSQQTV